MNAKKRTLALASALVISIAVAGCTKRDTGTLAGATVGGLLGSMVGGGDGRLIAIGLGTAAGAFLGGHIGSQLDEASKNQVAMNIHNSLENNPDGQHSVWNDPNRKVSSNVIPTRTFQTSRGEYCREYQHKIEIAGQSEQAYGTACRQPDGSWKIAS